MLAVVPAGEAAQSIFACLDCIAERNRGVRRRGDHLETTRTAQMIFWVDRAFAILLLLGAAGHAAGSFTLLPTGSDTQVWSLGSALCAMLLGALNFVRAGRADDRALAWITALGSLGWFAVAVAFGLSLGHLADFRVVWHGLSAAALALFSVRTALLAGKT